MSFFYDKDNLDRHGGLAIAPVLFTFGFIKSIVRHLSYAWRILGYVPNLDIGQGTSNKKSADEKQREHHMVLSTIFSKLQHISANGGFKTMVRSKEVVLKFFIQFIIGDTAGHNDLCTHFQKNAIRPCRDCLCHKEDLSKFDQSKCKPITMKTIIATDGDEEQLRQISQQHRVKNAFYNLPLSDRIR